MKTPSLFLIFLASLAVCACENQWMANILQPKTIYFESNGGSIVPSQKLYKGDTVQRPDDPYKPNSVFNGWFTDNDIFDNIWDFNDIPTGDMTLFAGWNDTGSSPSNPNNSTPVAEDFYIEGTGTQNYDGAPKAVTVTAMSGKTGGKITVYYLQATDGVEYSKTTAPPVNPGTYKVTFDVEAAEGWNAAYELYAGLLVIKTDSANSAGELADYLNSIPDNTAGTPVTISLNVSSLDGIANTLNNAPGKYVILDLSGSNITTIEKEAFYECAGLTGIVIPDGVTSIGEYAFYECTSLTSVIIPDGVTSIGEYAFGACTSLDKIIIPDSVTSIEKLAFHDCTSLTSIVIPNSVTSIEQQSFYQCASLTSVTIPNSVTSIGSGAFSHCFSLAAITIPASVNSIGDIAFGSCANLTSVTFEGTITAAGLSSGAFPDGLYNKYIATNGGGPGTYTRSGDGTQSSPYVWTKR